VSTQGTSKMVCPECGAEYILARKETHTSFWNLLFGQRRYESSLPVPPPWTYQHAAAPPAVQSSPGTALGPGEHEWRTMNLHADVTTPLRYAMVWAGEVVALGGSAALAIEVSPWFWLGTAGTIAGGIVYYLVTRPILATDDRWFRTRERDAEPPADDEKPSGRYAVEGRMEIEPGKFRYLHLDLSSYDAAVSWHRFCIAVTNGRNFSQTEAIKRHKLPPEDWTTVWTEFVKRDLVWPVKERETPRLKAEGKGWVSMYAHTPPPPPE